MSLAEFIRNAHTYLDRFEYDDYKELFPVFKAGLEEILGAAGERNTGKLMADLEQLSAGLARREQKDLLFKDKQVLALYFTPAALEIGGDAAVFAEELCAEWCERYPKEKYSPGTYDQLLKGFDSNLLGLPIRKSNKWRRKG